MTAPTLLTPLKKIRTGDVIEISGNAFQVRNTEREGSMTRLELEAEDKGTLTVVGLHSANFVVRKQARRDHTSPNGP